MKKTTFLLIGLIAVFVVACGGTPEPQIADETGFNPDSIEATSAAREAEAYPDPEEVPPTSTPESYPDPTAEPQPEPTAEPVAEAVAEAPSSGPATYSIDQEQTEVSFALDEDLRGERVTVVGISNLVTGDITFDLADPTAAQVGTITIDAADLETDSGNRNRAIRNFVLNTASFPNITFTPTSLNALPASVAVGETVNFEIVGDLTIKDVTLSVPFATTVTVNSDSEIAGSATATILYADFGLFIPDVPFVANVEDDLELTLNFVATAQ